MSSLIPLSHTPADTPVLLIDATAPYLDLEACAEQRLNAAKGLLYSLAHMRITDADPKDLHNLSDAAYLLLEDASEIYQAARNAAIGGRHIAGAVNQRE